MWCVSSSLSVCVCFFFPEGVKSDHPLQKVTLKFINWLITWIKLRSGCISDVCCKCLRECGGCISTNPWSTLCGGVFRSVNHQPWRPNVSKQQKKAANPNWEDATLKFKCFCLKNKKNFLDFLTNNCCFKHLLNRTYLVTHWRGLTPELETGGLSIWSSTT